MKDELRLEIPNGSMTVRIKCFLQEAKRNNIRKLFRLLHRNWMLQEEEEICMWLAEKEESEQSSRMRKRYQWILGDAEKIFGREWR